MASFPRPPAKQGQEHLLASVSCSTGPSCSDVYIIIYHLLEGEGSRTISPCFIRQHFPNHWSTDHRQSATKFLHYGRPSCKVFFWSAVQVFLKHCPTLFCSTAATILFTADFYASCISPHHEKKLPLRPCAKGTGAFRQETRLACRAWLL